MQPEQEIVQAAQSFKFDIVNHPDGKFAVLTFFTLPNGTENPENTIIAKFGLPYEAFTAMPNFIHELIATNNVRFPKDQSNADKGIQ